ncbi:MAG: AAA family ATPase [Candidatus Poriferisodalaceae bacterium]|nr:MAG: AAA family ATPase [Acidimicrobiales bacterium MED-G01]
MTNQNDAVLEALSLAVAARIPVLLWGPPGAGKSSAVESMCQSIDATYEVVIASIREPSDFSGLPVVTENGVEFAPPRWAKRLSDAGTGVLFLDEISTAPPAVQAALLRVVLERVVGDLTLPDDLAIIAAANPPDQAADGWDLSAPLANRFCHLDWRVDPTTVATGLVAGFPTPYIPLLPSDWQNQIPIAAGQVGGFLSVRRSLVIQPPAERALAGRAWPSPRTWEMLSRLLAAAAAVNASSETRRNLVIGCVGDGVGLEFLTWLQELDLPDPEAALMDPENVVFPDRGDRLYAAVSAVASAVAADPTPDRWLAGWRVLERAAGQSPDIGAIAARVLAQVRPDGVSAPPEAAVFLPVLEAAGLLE